MKKFLLIVLLVLIVLPVVMIFKPVEEVGALPAEKRFATVYYVKGKSDPEKTGRWAEKRYMLARAETFDMRLSEEELNSWMSSGFKKVKEGKYFGVTAEVPNFRLTDGKIQLAVPLELMLFSKKFPTLTQVRGHLVRHGWSYVFRVDEVYLGSLPVHKIPFLGDWVIEKGEKSLQLPNDIKRGWSRITRAGVEEGQIHLVAEPRTPVIISADEGGASE